MGLTLRQMADSQAQAAEISPRWLMINPEAGLTAIETLRRAFRQFGGFFFIGKAVCH